MRFRCERGVQGDEIHCATPGAGVNYRTSEGTNRDRLSRFQCKALGYVIRVRTNYRHGEPQ